MHFNLILICGILIPMRIIVKITPKKHLYHYNQSKTSQAIFLTGMQQLRQKGQDSMRHKVTFWCYINAFFHDCLVEGCTLNINGLC